MGGFAGWEVQGSELECEEVGGGGGGGGGGGVRGGGEVGRWEGWPDERGGRK